MHGSDVVGPTWPVVTQARPETYRWTFFFYISFIVDYCMT